MGDKADVWLGTLSLMVLKTLESMGPQHGYGMARRIEQVRSLRRRDALPIVGRGPCFAFVQGLEGFDVFSCLGQDLNFRALRHAGVRCIRCIVSCSDRFLYRPLSLLISTNLGQPFGIHAGIADLGGPITEGLRDRPRTMSRGPLCRGRYDDVEDPQSVRHLHRSFRSR
jgi:hypothetical protein